MIKKLHLALLIMLVTVLIASCAPKPTPPVTEEAPPAEEAIVNEVAADISDTASVEEELDTSELADVDSILADIENI
jgi:hypothetical protein